MVNQAHEVIVERISVSCRVVIDEESVIYPTVMTAPLPVQSALQQCNNSLLTYIY
jgi:hypothetical protein